ncbi:hypothetical protein [Thalassospira xiamenensis]|uniref:Uncharacterized protein n=1 Tax=Thalassospira xiamenensis TaxID=220697 RepID=A0A285TVD9_9PROT|nr:hypothetical protein [Thalassospira xiamenensis]SOC28194.1 hypothetical protein SAMN05428964_106138 [Thalassospira xiamenensis]
MTPPPVFPMIGSDQETDAGKNEMPLLRYASRCGWISEELKDELSGEQQEDVYEAIARMTVSVWTAFRRERSDEIAALAVATPQQRKKLLLKAKPKDRGLLLFGASQYCLEAKEILAAIHEHCQPGLSYRKMIAAAHQVISDYDKCFPIPWAGQLPPPFGNRQWFAPEPEGDG